MENEAVILSKAQEANHANPNIPGKGCGLYPQVYKNRNMFKK